MGVSSRGGRRRSSKLREVAIKMVVAACGSFSIKPQPQPPSPPPPPQLDPVNVISGLESPTKPSHRHHSNSDSEHHLIKNVTSKNLCAICLEALSYSTGSSPGQAIFTAQCSHAFHFTCISSNVRHGNITCPVCRAHWTQLPRNLKSQCSLSRNQNDPIFRILDDSIATFRVHRRSFLQTARYDDDDPIEPDDTPNRSRLDFSIVPVCSFYQHHPCAHSSSLQVSGAGPTTSHSHHRCRNLTSSSSSPSISHSITSQLPSYNRTAAYLSVKLSHQLPTDLVLVASPNGPHLRLLKQSMALVVFSLRPIDRLAIVIHSSAAARVFPLRRMTSYGKRTALQVIDRLFYMGQADPIEGLKKGIKILEDRAHKNPHSSILHLSDCPTRTYHGVNMQVPVPIHQFHVGFGFGTSNGFVMHKFEEFLARTMGGSIQDIQLRIGDGGRIIKLGELKGNEERRILVEFDEDGQVCVGYNYVEGGMDECIRTGETVVSIGIKGDVNGVDEEGVAGRDSVTIMGGRTSNVESWDYHDPYMARRWSKHLHGYRL